jgi:hypothetical protein
VDVMREARAHLELKGEITGELQGGQEAAHYAVIVVAAMVPPGTPADLKACLPPEQIQRARAERTSG